MLQNLINLFNLKLFGMYLVVTAIFTIVMVKLYLTTLKRIGEGKSYKAYVAVAFVIYALVIGFLIYTIVVYGYLSVTVTSAVMYIIMYYPMKRFTNWINKKRTEIALS